MPYLTIVAIHNFILQFSLIFSPFLAYYYQHVHAKTHPNDLFSRGGFMVLHPLQEILLRANKPAFKALIPGGSTFPSVPDCRTMELLYLKISQFPEGLLKVRATPGRFGSSRHKFAENWFCIRTENIG